MIKKTHFPTRPWSTLQCNVVKIRLNFLKKILIRGSLYYLFQINFSKTSCKNIFSLAEKFIVET